MPETRTSAVLSKESLEDALRNLTDADWARLRKTSEYYARAHRIEADDLLQSALERALSGTRKCPAGVDVVYFLKQAMRSIASGETEKGHREPLLVAIANEGGSEQPVHLPSIGLDPESAVAELEHITWMKRGILELFKDDDVTLLLVEGMMEGFEGEELRELVEIDKTTYESKRKLIRRRIDKKYPKGIEE